MINRIIKALLVGTMVVAILVSVVSPIVITICTGAWGAAYLFVFTPLLCAILLLVIET